MHKFLENQGFKPHIWEWRKIFAFDPILLCHLLFSKIRFISKSNAQHNFENPVKATFICNNGFNACVLLQTKGWNGWCPFQIIFCSVLQFLIWNLADCFVYVLFWSSHFQMICVLWGWTNWNSDGCDHIFACPCSKNFPLTIFPSQSCII